MAAKRSLQDFQRFKVPQLTSFLKDMGLKSIKKTKDELVALAFAAEEMELPILPSPKQYQCENAKSYANKLKVTNAPHP